MKWLTLIRERDWRFHLSRLVPLPMRAQYTVTGSNGSWRESARWVQWRGRVLRHHVAITD